MAQGTVPREETLAQPGQAVHQPLTLAMSIAGDEGQRDLPRLGLYGLGVELTDFIAVRVWQGDYLALARHWAEALRNFPGGKCLHGAFIDLSPGAQEPEVVDFA